MDSNKYLPLFLIITLLCVSCMEKNTTDPVKAYKNWMGGKEPPEGLQPIRAKYWESAHWSKEYEIFIEMQATTAWRRDVLNESNFERASAYDLPSKAPSWFKPHPADKIWKFSLAGESFYLEDTLTGRILVYEIQL